MKLYLTVILALIFMSSDAYSQDSALVQRDAPPKDLGLSIHFGFARTGVSELNDLLGEYGYEKVDDYRLAGGLAYNYLETEQFSHEVVLDFVAVEKLEAGNNGASKMKQYGFSLMIRLGGRLYAREDQRLQFLLGTGFSWSYLSRGIEQSFAEYFSSNYARNTEVFKMSYIIQPGLRYQYWIDEGLPVGVIIGWTIPILSGDWSNASTPLLTRGYEIMDGPSTSVSGPFASIQIPLFLYTQSN